MKFLDEKFNLFCLGDTTTCENGPTEQLTYTNATNEKESIVMNLLKDIESQKDVRMKWSNNIPTRNNLLEPILGASGNIRAKKNAVVETLEGKQQYEMFDYFVNQEMKEMILEETSRYASEDNSTLFQLTMSNLNTFNAILMLAGYHSLPRTQMFWEKFWNDYCV